MQIIYKRILLPLYLRQEAIIEKLTGIKRGLTQTRKFLKTLVFSFCKTGVVGVDNIKKLLEDLPNKIMNAFVIVVDIEAAEENGKQFVKISVPKSQIKGV